AFNITDNQDELINYTVIVDGSAVNSSEIANSTIESINLAALSDGLHYLVVEVFDEAGNRFNSTPVQFFTVDTAPPLQNMQPVLRGDLDGYFVVGDYFNMSVNFTDVTGATQNVTFNMSSICDDFVVTKTAIESDYWQANCTVDINVDFSPVNITYLFCDTVGNCNSSFYTVVLFNFTYPSDVDGILTFYHDQTTDLTTESNLNDVPFTLELNINGATLPGQPWIGFKNALRLNFSSIDFTDPQAQTDLQNLATAINITIRNPKNGEYGGSRIYVDTGAFAALDTDATIRLSYLPFTGLEAANLMNDTGGSDSISGVRYVSNLDGTGNLTFTVTGFSGYNVTDSALPEITINSPLNNTYSQALYLNFTFNGTGTEIDNTTVNVTLTVAGIDIYYAFENFTCVASDNYQVQECYQLMAGLPDGVYTIAASANDYGGASGNFAIVSGENITLDTTSPTVSSLNAPTNASYLNYTTVTFNFTAYDNLDTFLAYTLYLDGAANETGVMANGTAANFTLVVSEARHNWTIGVTDDSGKTANYTGQFNFYADTTAPTTSSNEPTGWQTTAFNVILTPADTVAGVYYTTYLYDGAASNGTNVSVTTSGNHTIAYYSVDYSGNVESTLTVYAALDVVNPVVSSLNAPANGSQQLPDVVFNFTAYDDIDTNLSYTLFLNSTANVTGYAPNNTATVFSVNFPEGADYYWTIQVADDSGRAANFSGNYVFSIYEFAPTSAPILDASGVNDTDSDGNIEIGWAADANATYYRVYRQSTNITNATDADLLATIAAPTTQFQDNTSVNGTTYWYAVTSVDSALNENKTIVSASFSVTSNDTILPKLPLNTGATTNTDGSVTVSWNAVTQDINNNSDTIIVYRVWKTTNLTGLNLSADAENVSDTLSTSYTDTSITTGTNYTYIITAIDDGSNHNNTRSDSNTISIEPSACSNSYTYSSWSTCSSSTQSRTGTRTCYGGGANSTTGSQSCTSESSGSSSSSSPSTSTTPSNPVQVHMWQLLSKGTSTIMSITNPNLGITELVIGLKEDVKNARLSVEALSDKPSGTPNFIGRVYKYLKIDKGTITDSSLIGAKIKFKVEKSWLSENGILAQNIVLKRLTANWYDLPTKKSSEDGNYIYYEADTPGFSFFIIGVNPSIEQINAPEPVQQEIIEPQPEVIEETTPAVAAPEENNAPLPVPVAVRKTGNPALLIIAIIAGLLGIYLFAINRKSEKVEKKDHIDKSIRELETKLKDIEQVHKKKKL
ncbi:MAG: PGF-pre-PGF domain-containing protein, partial [archaeon]